MPSLSVPPLFAALEPARTVLIAGAGGGFLGALSIPGASREATLYRDAVAYGQAATPLRPSIAHGQIAVFPH
jgi:hypothetical protein